MKIKDLTNSMLNEIKAQGKKLETIHDNVIDVNKNLQNANLELQKTDDASTKNSSLMKWVTLLLGVIFTIGVLIYLVFYYRK